MSETWKAAQRYHIRPCRGPAGLPLQIAANLKATDMSEKSQNRRCGWFTRAS